MRFSEDRLQDNDLQKACEAFHMGQKQNGVLEKVREKKNRGDQAVEGTLKGMALRDRYLLFCKHLSLTTGGGLPSHLEMQHVPDIRPGDVPGQSHHLPNPS